MTRNFLLWIDTRKKLRRKKIIIKKIISREAHLVTCSHLSVTYESV